jgi:ribonuclease-3
LEPLFAALGREVDPALLDRALTHPSAATAARPHYQRLEFLGDRVLNLLIAEALLERFPDEPEGRLAPRLNELVRRETCAEIAREIELGAHLRLDRAEARGGGRRRETILADAMEAVIAALWLDGGPEAARAAVLRLWGPRIDAQGAAAPQDAKTALQEWAQARGMAPPGYRVVERAGPDHAPRFTVEARLEDGAAETAAAATKRGAEQAAAAALLGRLQDG